MYPRNKALDHPAAALLLDYAENGCPASCGPNWSIDQIHAYISYNNHTSAQQQDAALAVRTEVLQKVADGLCVLVDWDTLKDNMPLNLKVSPLAAIPHKSRAFRMILDLSFQHHTAEGTKYDSVNSAPADPTVPEHSQNELGNVIPRLLWALAKGEPTTPFFFTKVDIKDGFWRMRVSDDDVWNFAYVLPRLNPNDPLQLVIPSALQMGWRASPPYFDAGSETARDLADDYAQQPLLPPHPFEHHLMSLSDNDKKLLNDTPTPLPQHRSNESYIDDFIAAIQTRNISHLRHAGRALLHAINDIFPPPELTGSQLEHPISLSKLSEDGAWATTKEILGWTLNGESRTISISSNKFEKITQQLDALIQVPRTRSKTLEKLKGKLNWLSDAIVTGKPLLGDLDEYYYRRMPQNKVWITMPPEIISTLRDWKILVTTLFRRPTSVYELIPTMPAYTGTSDASKWGAGGIWFSASQPLLPIVWFLEWPPAIKADLEDNTISIAALELAAILLQWLTLEYSVPPHLLRHVSVATRADNTNAVAWTNKLRSSRDPTANRILKALTLRLHYLETAPFNVAHISGIYNKMADVASRKHPTDPKNFLTSFSKIFPPPQNNCWHLCTLPKKLIKQVFSLIQTTPSNLALWQQPMSNGAVFGSVGQLSWTPTTTLSSTTFQTLTANNKLHCWVPSPTMYGLDTTHAPSTTDLGLQVHKELQWRSEPSPRPLYWTEALHPWKRRKALIHSSSNESSPPTPGTTRPLSQS
jgi:hypothetical protein